MSKHLSYLPKLDGLRALAALMVLTAHFIEDLHVDFSFSYGGFGVQIFFVISGFLITSILLKQKDKMLESKPKMIRNFIIKRALRLFPIYYLLLIGLMILSKLTGIWISEAGTKWYYFTYTQNILFYDIGFQSSMLNHTWSLAVEEQFYLFWPFFILYVPKKHELKAIAAVFLIGVLTRFYLTNYYIGNGTIKGVTFMHFDTLGAGALMAYSLYYQKERVIRFMEKYSTAMLLLTVPVSYYLMCNRYCEDFLLPLLVTLMSVSIVYISVSGSKFILNPILAFPPLIYFGRISYGVYLYHKPVPLLFNLLVQKTGFGVAINKFVLFGIYMAITILIASLSWKWIEQPISKLKERFDF